VKDVLCCWFGSAGGDRASEGLLGAGRRLADDLGGGLHGVVLGPCDDGTNAARVVDALHVADRISLAAYSPEQALCALTTVSKELRPRAVLLANDSYSQELAPRLAHRLGGAAAGDATGVSILGDELRVTRTVYGGKATAVLALRRSPAVVWLRARAMQPATSRRPTPAPIHALDVPEQPLPDAPRLVERSEEVREGARLEDARCIVSGGRGLGGPEPFELLKQLADVLGAQVAASRAACDAGWAPPSWQVGQTGKRVAPELYLAIGISGASQHLIGIADAKTICAVNTDPQAPIFKHCRFGLVEDYRNVVGPLREKLLAMKG
jgi:electron transfer flavoprotein alpha subunit